MKGLETLEQQSMFLKAVGTVLANEDLGFIKDTISLEYSSSDLEIIDFKVGFSAYYKARLGQKICDECKKLGLKI